MRRIQVKIWPELTGYLPAIIPFDRIDKAKVNPIDIDFSNVSCVESSSLNLILIKLIKIASSIKNRDWDIKSSELPGVNEKIINLSFFEILNKNIPYNKLFREVSTIKDITNNLYKRNSEVENSSVSFPIYEVNFSTSNRRASVEDFKDYLVDNLQYLYPKYQLKVNKLIQVLHEIAKNSADHTEQNAYFGLDIQQYRNELLLKFSFGDLGVGINQNVRQVLQKDEGYQSKHKHLAITDSYNYALSMGFTSKPYSTVNRGIGMSTIFDLSKQINLNLSVFDAESRGVLSSAKYISHAELRKVFYNVGFNVGFYYYGELKHTF